MPECCIEHLSDVLDSWCRQNMENSFKFNHYNARPTKCSGAHGPSLSGALKLMEGLSLVTEVLEFKYSDLKQALDIVIKRYSVTKQNYTLEQQLTLSGDTATSLMTMMTHARRLKKHEKFVEACKGCSSFQIRNLEALRKLVLQCEDCDESEVGALPSTAGKSKPSIVVEDDVPNTQEILALSQCSSDATQEALNYDLNSSSENDLLQEALGSNPVPVRKEHIREVMKRPAGKDAQGKLQKVPKKDVECVTAALASIKSGKQEKVKMPATGSSTSLPGDTVQGGVCKNFTFSSSTTEWEECKAEFYTSKSYIRYKCKATGKWLLVIGTQGLQRQQKLMQLAEHAKKKNMTKEKLVQIRAQL